MGEIMASWLARICSPMGIDTSGSSQSTPQVGSERDGISDATNMARMTTTTSGNLLRPDDVVASGNDTDALSSATTSPPTPAGAAIFPDEKIDKPTRGSGGVTATGFSLREHPGEVGISGDGPRKSAEVSSMKTDSFLRVKGNISSADIEPETRETASGAGSIFAVEVGGTPLEGSPPSTTQVTGAGTKEAPRYHQPCTNGTEETTVLTGLKAHSFPQPSAASTSPEGDELVASGSGDAVESVGSGGKEEGRGMTPWLEALLLKAKRQQQQHQQNRKQKDQETNVGQEIATSHGKVELNVGIKTAVAGSATHSVEGTASPGSTSKSNKRASNKKKKAASAKQNAMTAVATAGTTASNESVLARYNPVRPATSVGDHSKSPSAPWLQALLSPATPSEANITPSASAPPPPLSPPKIQRDFARLKPSSKKKGAGGRKNGGVKRPASARFAGDGDERVRAAVGADCAAGNSVSPRPTQPKPRKGRVRTRSLGSKAEAGASGSGGGGGDGKKNRKKRGVGNEGKGQRKGQRGVLEEGPDGNREEGGLEALDADADPFSSPVRADRRVYKGWEHGKVKFLFPNMSPWRRNRLRFDEESLWSVTDQKTADEISNFALLLPGVSAETIVVDGTACVGGNVISFTSTFDEVWAVEIDRDRFDMLTGNVKRAAGASPTAGHVRFFHNDFLNVLEVEEHNVGAKRPVVFLDPPWGGVDYKKQEEVSLFLSDTPLAEVCGRAAKAGARHVLLKVPTNFNLRAFRDAIGIAGRVSVHERNLRKMLLVAVDYDRRPLPASPAPSSPALSPEMAPPIVDQDYQQQPQQKQPQQQKQGPVLLESVGIDAIRSDHVYGGGGIVSGGGDGATGAAADEVAEGAGSTSDGDNLCAYGGSIEVASPSFENRTYTTVLADAASTTNSSGGAVDNTRSDGPRASLLSPNAPVFRQGSIEDDVRETAGTSAECSLKQGSDSTSGADEREENGVTAVAGARKRLKELLGLDTSGDGGGGGGMSALFGWDGVGASTTVDVVNEESGKIGDVVTGVSHAEQNPRGDGNVADEIDGAGEGSKGTGRDEDEAEGPMDGARQILEGFLSLKM